MQKQITALLVVHDEPASAMRALKAIEAQTTKPSRVVIIDTSKVPGEFQTESQTLPHKTKLGAIIRTGIEGLEVSPNHWLWLVHDDSEPKPNALAELLQATENSETIAQVGPLQLSSNKPREISQLGIKLSRFGEIINPLKGQLDQSQHDQAKDVLAVGTSGMLVRTDAYEKVGGIDDNAPALAADVDLSMKLRRNGYRVVVAPRAKVSHASLTLSGKRGRNWLRGSTTFALRRATIHLRLVHDPLPLAFLYWLALPLTTIYRIFWRLAQKQPGYLWAETKAGVWGFLTLLKRLTSRSKAGSIPTRMLNPLMATWSEVAAHNRQALETEESAQTLAAFERGEHEIAPTERSKTFTQSMGWVFIVLLLGLSWNQLPISEALTGGAAIPLSNDWFNLFARAGASWQPIGQGFVGPSDPFNWVLLALGSLTFWAPNLSLVFLLWFARALAFSSAWRALSLLSAKAWQRNLGALTYALLPAFTASISVGEFPAIISTILCPWLIFAIARAAGLGRSGSARSDARTWSWVGLSGVLLAVVGSATPALVILTILGLALVALTKFRRFGYLFWIPLPLAAIYVPLALYEIVGLGQPLALLAEPTFWANKTSTGFGVNFALTDLTTWALAALVLLAAFSLLTKRWVVSAAIAGFGLASYLLLAFSQSLRFPADTLNATYGIDRVSNSGHAVAAVIGFVVVALVIHFTASFDNKVLLATAGVVIALTTAPLSWLSLTTPQATNVSDGSVVPLLLQKQAEQGSGLQLLVINQKENSYHVKWIPIAGVHLEDSNLAYRFSSNSISKNETYQLLSQAVGDLVSGNGAAKVDTLRNNSIGYVLVPNGVQNGAVVAALESSELLESAGLTPFGELWRVVGTSTKSVVEISRNPWSVTKLIQLITLLGFALLAIPARPRIKRATDSAIFIDQSESELNV